MTRVLTTVVDRFRSWKYARIQSARFQTTPRYFDRPAEDEHDVAVIDYIWGSTSASGGPDGTLNTIQLWG